MATAKEEREAAGQVGTISTTFKKSKSRLGSTSSSINEKRQAAAQSEGESIIAKQKEFSSLYQKGTLLTQEDNSAEQLEDLLGSSALSGDSGFTHEFSDVLGTFDPDSFLKSFRGYVASRSGQINQAKTTSKTFLTGEI